jgi:hypothetical protein
MKSRLNLNIARGGRVVICALAAMWAAAGPMSQARAQCDGQELAKMIAADGAANDQLGTSVGMSGAWLFVGAPLNNNPHGGNAGAVYVYRWDDGGTPLDYTDDAVTYRQKLTAAGVGSGDEFGVSAAVSGSWAVVGAWYDDSAGDETGAAYVYRLNDGGTPGDPSDDSWIEHAALTTPTLDAEDRFGGAVAIDGAHLVVGAMWEEQVAARAGAAYVFVHDDGGTPGVLSDDAWTYQATLVASDGVGSALFGSSVDLKGGKCVVGAPHHEGSAVYTGSAYVYRWDDGGTPGDPSDDTWPQEDALVAGDASYGDRLGYRVGISGDWVVAGAYTDDNGGMARGSAYIFRCDDAGTPGDPADDEWIEHAKFDAHDTESWDNFGESVAIRGDTLAVGVRMDDDMGSSSGSVYIFTRDAQGTPGDLSDDLWVETAKHTASDGQAADVLGTSVVLDGDMLLSGAPREDESAIDAGAAYLFAAAAHEDCNLNGVCDVTDILSGTSADANGNGVPDECEDTCPWDTAPIGAPDGVVGLGDLNALLSNWGPCPPPCAYDFAPVGAPDGMVGLGDLNALLSNWGPCP